MFRPLLLDSSNRIRSTASSSISNKSIKWRINNSIVDPVSATTGRNGRHSIGGRAQHQRCLLRRFHHYATIAVTTHHPSMTTSVDRIYDEQSTISPSSPFSNRSFSTSKLNDDNSSNPPSNASTIKPTAAVAAVNPMDSRRVYRYLQLSTFTQDEIHGKFHKIQKGGEGSSTVGKGGQFVGEDCIDKYQVRKFIEKEILSLEDISQSYYVNKYKDDENVEDKTNAIRQDYINTETHKFVQFFIEDTTGGNDNEKTAIRITRDDFTTKLIESASSVDFKRSWPITVSMLLIGSSVGVVTPVMPFVVQNLGLTAGEYGLVVSAFALAKMSGNIPSAVLVERHGRKPYLVYTLVVVAFGVGGIGFANSFEHLYLCRLLTGLGVAGISTAATLTLTDISTPLNRASTMAPIMSAFAAGTALGPALGGVLCDQIGVNPTFYIVGVSYFGLAAVNWALLDETMASNKPIKFPWQSKAKRSTVDQQETITESFTKAVGQWIPLLSEPPVRNVCIMNAFYWMALAGSQMTLLPLILTDPNGLAMSATNVGQVYMGMSLIQVLGNPVFAKVVDNVGKTPGIVSGCTLISTAMASLPFCSDLYQMAGVFAVWATGSSLLSTSPLAYISDTVDEKERAQAIALLRTSGDVGFLVGASSMGALADWAGSLDTALQSSAGILLTATGWFATRQLLTSRMSKTRQ